MKTYSPMIVILWIQGRNLTLSIGGVSSISALQKGVADTNRPAKWCDVEQNNSLLLELYFEFSIFSAGPAFKNFVKVYGVCQVFFGREDD